MKNLLKSIVFSLSTLVGLQLAEGQAVPIAHTRWTTNATPAASADGTGTAVAGAQNASAQNLGTSIGDGSTADLHGVSIGNAATGGSGTVAIGYGALAGFPGVTPDAASDISIGYLSFVNQSATKTNIVNFGTGIANTENTFNWLGLPLFNWGAGGVISLGTNVVGAGNINAVTNTQATVNFGAYSTVTYANFNTNSFDLINAYQYPLANGHYAFSTIYSAYTNSVRTNVLLFFNNSLGSWEVGTNLNDTTGSKSWYDYEGVNSFPTNDPASWGAGDANIGNMASPASVDIGILSTSNNVIHSITPSGYVDENLDQAGHYYSIVNDTHVGRLRDEVLEGNYQSQGWDDRVTWYGGTGALYTNDFNAAHNYSAGVTTWRLNGGVADLVGDYRGIVELGTTFGRLVLTNGVADRTHAGDNGSIFEILPRRNNTNSTTVQAGVFMHPFKVDGLGRVMMGNIPEAEHGIYAPAVAWVDIREGTAAIPQLLLRKTPAYTGPSTNGGLYSDGVYIHTLQNGGDAIALTGTNSSSNGGSLTNLNLTKGNFNANPHMPAAVTLTGSVFTFSNATPSVLECYFSGSVAYSVTKNGVGVFGSLAADGYFLLQPTNQCAITYTVAPTLYTNSMF